MNTLTCLSPLVPLNRESIEMNSKLACIILFLLIAQLTSAQTFTDVVNEVVPDDGSVVTFEMAVSGLPSTIDTTFGVETVCFNITHTWDSDLQIKLIAPDGTIVLLISGVGGVSSGQDAAALMMCGANLVGIATATFANPKAVIRINQELADFCFNTGVVKVSELTNTIEMPT